MCADPESVRSLPNGTILVVDDLDASLEAIDDMLSAEGFRVTRARDGDEALRAVARENPDLVLSDVRMPNVDGFELCRALKASPNTRLTPVVLMTGARDQADRLIAIEAGASDFITKPIDRAELNARVRSLVKFKHLTDELDSAEDVLRSLALLIEARDASTDGHCQRLAQYAVAFGAELDLDDDDIQALRRGGYFHDIGKIAIPDAILLKPGLLTDSERQRMRDHPIVGDTLCGNLRTLSRVRPIVRHHHERLDGSGYPDGLKGDQIPLLAQVIAIVDVYDALTTQRPYRLPVSHKEAFNELGREARRGRFRQDLVDAFVASRELAEESLRLPPVL